MKKKGIEKNNNWINAGYFVVNSNVFKQIKNLNEYFEDSTLSKFIKKRCFSLQTR